MSDIGNVKKVKVSKSGKSSSSDSGAVKVKKHKEEPEEEPEVVETEEEEEPSEEEEEEESTEEELTSDDDDDVSLNTNDILQNDPLFFVLSKIFVTTDESSTNVADVLQNIVERLDTLIEITKKANKRS
jgi:hypothetical protein